VYSFLTAHCNIYNLTHKHTCYYSFLQHRVLKNVSVASTTNERYALGAPSIHDHDNEDEYLVDESSDSSSAYLCVLDGHDGRNAVDFVKKYLQTSIHAILQSKNPENAMQRCIRNADTEYFKNLDQYFVEKLTIQMTIPEVNLCVNQMYYLRVVYTYLLNCSFIRE